MALSKIYTLAKVESLLRILTLQLGLSKVKFGDIRAIVNKNTLDLAELLNGASQPFYQEIATLSDAASNVADAKVAASAYDDTTRLVTDAAHGLTAADIGKRIYVENTGDDKYVITEIESITNANNFVIKDAMGIDAVAPNYVVWDNFSGSYLDISALKIDKIIKLVSSNLGEFSPAGDSDFENLSNIDEYDNEIFYNQVGERIYLHKGSSVTTAYGTISLHYYRLPNLVTDRTDYIDMKDNHIPLLIDRCKLDLYELSEKSAPANLTDSVTMKVRELLNASASKEAKIKDKAASV